MKEQRPGMYPTWREAALILLPTALAMAVLSLLAVWAVRAAFCG
jgi:hypothetical protein